MARRDAVAAPPLTHHVVWEIAGPAKPWALVRAVCGALVRNRESVPVPTCPKCSHILAEMDNNEP